VTLREVADELYGLPLAEFTKRRNALAKQLRSQERDLAEAVARLPKPATAAWAVNLLSRERGEQLAELLTLGGRLREAQDDAAGDVLRKLTGQSRAVVRALVEQTQRVATHHGTSVSDAVLRQVELTLRAALADELAAGAVEAGLLTRPLLPAGFGDVDVADAVAVLSSPQRPAPTRAEPSPARRTAKPAGERRREEAGRAVKAALKELEAAEREVAGREADLDAVAAAHEQARLRVAELRDELDRCEAKEAALAGDVRDARRQREAALRRGASARRAAERAQARHDKLR
jgi:hypothetical protein